MAGVANSGPGSRMAFSNANSNSQQQPPSQLQQSLTPLPRPSPNNICTTAPMSTTHTAFSISNSGTTSQFIPNNQQQVSVDTENMNEIKFPKKKHLQLVTLIRFFFSFRNNNSSNNKTDYREYYRKRLPYSPYRNSRHLTKCINSSLTPASNRACSSLNNRSISSHWRPVNNTWIISNNRLASVR